MRFIVDECTGPIVAKWLRDEGHDVFSVFDEARGMTDDDILDKAAVERWVLITNDKDFGEKIFRERRGHHGAVLLRLHDERAAIKVEALRQLIERYASRLPITFVVVSEGRVRFAKS